MKFVSKTGNAPFWVEDYNADDLAFFISLGFVEKKAVSDEEVAKRFGLKPTLNFAGTGNFGSWTQKEANKIVYAIYDQYPKIKQVKVHKYVGE